MPNPIENFVAKVAGKAAAVEARLKGLKGVFNKLAEQHHEVAALLSQLESADDPTTRAGLWHEVRRELVSHEQAELIELYPALAASEGTRDIALAHSADASELEELVRELDGIVPQSADFRPAVSRLIAKVKEHADTEEGMYFRKAQEALGEAASQQLEEPFLRAQEMAKSKLS